MHGQAAWQIEALSSGDDPATLVIVLGGRWCIDQHLPTADTLNDRLAPPVPYPCWWKPWNSNPMPSGAVSGRRPHPGPSNQKEKT